MLCDACVEILRDGKGQVSSEVLVQTFDHHKTFAELRCSAQDACLICMDLARLLRSSRDVADDGPLSARAYLRKIRKEPGLGSLFRLEFDMYEYGNCLFALNEAGK
jgi:hypothetical protein